MTPESTCPHCRDRPELEAFVKECVSVFAQFTNRGGKKGGLAYKMGQKAVALREKFDPTKPVGTD